eukprot:CAMPEP_0181314640 /NCGR_PEP_ID=MMETSP1101-20121128/14930_1 /TAXON_ID=46948 /ORGANISM="Rhodomonas abbreviata, Strain Caron Lab Isolate" /LENGTH=166 /DNA_ID=CAMNT_0023421755 /DNA_START=372 /DNA_END=872 /DNA_ORIENTATION=-
MMRFHEPAAPRGLFAAMDTDSDPSDNSMEVADIEDWSEESEEIADVDEWSDEDDDEDVRDTNWQSVFEQFQREDTQRDAERAERRRQQQLEEEAAADRARAEAQRLIEAARAQEPVAEELGSISYVSQAGSVCVARLTQSGCVVYQGQRFPCVAKWLHDVFGRRTN